MIVNITRLLLLVLVSCFIACNQQAKTLELTDDGTWCWFSDPRAIYLPDDGGTMVTGFVTEDGSVASLQYHLKTGEKTITVLNEKLEVDDHNNPAFLQRADGRLLAFYTRHHNTELFMNISTHPGDAKSWEQAIIINPNGKDDLEKFGDDKYTYANPMMLKGENNRIYLFGRWIGFKPNFTWSDDGGNTWAPGRVVVSPQPFSWGERPYVKYYSDGQDKIHLVFTDGHPRDEAFNSVYYACYYRGAFYKADGELICSVDQLPFEPKDASLVYDAKTSGHRAWVFDISADKQGNPSIAYARYPSENDHIYHYAWFDGAHWNDREVLNAGKWFPQTPDGKREREPNYSGGLVIEPHQQHALFVSREVNTTFEIEKWAIDPKTDQWKVTPVTSNSATDQVRPFVIKNSPEGAGSLLLWNAVDRYIHYTDYRTSVMFSRIGAE